MPYRGQTKNARVGVSLAFSAAAATTGATRVVCVLCCLSSLRPQRRPSSWARGSCWWLCDSTRLSTNACDVPFTSHLATLGSQAMSKLGLKTITGVNRVTIRKSKNVRYVPLPHGVGLHRIPLRPNVRLTEHFTFEVYPLELC